MAAVARGPPAAERLSRVAGQLLASAGPSLTKEDVEHFEREGFVVLRGAFTADDLKALKVPIRRAYDSHQ